MLQTILMSKYESKNALQSKHKRHNPRTRHVNKYITRVTISLTESLPLVHAHGEVTQRLGADEFLFWIRWTQTESGPRFIHHARIIY